MFPWSLEVLEWRMHVQPHLHTWPIMSLMDPYFGDIRLTYAEFHLWKVLRVIFSIYGNNQGKEWRCLPVMWSYLERRNHINRASRTTESLILHVPSRSREGSPLYQTPSRVSAVGFAPPAVKQVVGVESDRLPWPGACWVGHRPAASVQDRRRSLPGRLPSVLDRGSWPVSLSSSLSEVAGRMPCQMGRH